MAKFEPAYWKIVESEGLWSNDAADSGGETVLGITKNYDPDWEGWKIVDAQKPAGLNDKEKTPEERRLLQKQFIANLTKVKPELHEKAIPFYKVKYWDKIWGDKINNQEEAYKIVDMQINAGTMGITLAQRALGIKETGKMNQLTLDTLNNQV